MIKQGVGVSGFLFGALLLVAALLLSAAASPSSAAPLSKALSPSKAENKAWALKIGNKIEQLLLGSGIAPANMALWLQRVQDEENLYQHNHDHVFTPASVTKLFAGGAFLEHLPLQFSTQLLAVGPIEAVASEGNAAQQRVLRGDLYLKGGGDAHFTSESMWNLVRALARTRVKKIEGHIVVDDTLFPAQQSRFPSNGRAYNAPISSMLLNWSVVNIYVRGGPQVGTPAWVDIDPGPTAVRIVNKATTSERTQNLVVRRLKGRVKEGRKMIDPSSATIGGVVGAKSSGASVSSSEVDTDVCVRDTIELTGRVSRHAKEKLIYRSITRPSCWSAFNLIDFLKLYNIQVQNKARLDSTPMRARVLAEHKSLTTPELVQKMMKFSNNSMTEMMYQHFKLVFQGVSGSRSLSSAAVAGDGEATRRSPVSVGDASFRPFGDTAKLEHYIRSYGVRDFKLNSVSGLSRENKFKAVDVGRYLLRMREHPRVGVDFVASLPVSGGQGTLEKRLTAPPTKGRVRAKTGMLNGVVALAGFAQHPQQGELVFVYFFNGPSAQNERAKQLIDNVLEQILKI